MSLNQELGFQKPIALRPHEALLNIYYTASCMRKRASDFFRKFGLTDVQFNLMVLLRHQSGTGGRLSQSSISNMMLVNRANITSLVDRMEKSGLVIRTAATGDRRFNMVKLTNQGSKILDQVEPLYATEVRKIMAAYGQAEQKKLITMLEKIRGRIKNNNHSQNHNKN